MVNGLLFHVIQTVNHCPLSMDRDLILRVNSVKSGDNSIVKGRPHKEGWAIDMRLKG